MSFEKGLQVYFGSYQRKTSGVAYISEMFFKSNALFQKKRITQPFLFFKRYSYRKPVKSGMKIEINLKTTIMDTTLNTNNDEQSSPLNTSSEKSELMQFFENQVHDAYWAYKDLLKEIFEGDVKGNA